MTPQESLDELSKAIDKNLLQIKKLISQKQIMKEMLITLYRTMDEDHFYKDQLRTTLKEVEELE